MNKNKYFLSLMSGYEVVEVLDITSPVSGFSKEFKSLDSVISFIKKIMKRKDSEAFKIIIEQTKTTKKNRSAAYVKANWIRKCKR